MVSWLEVSLGLFVAPITFFGLLIYFDYKDRGKKILRSKKVDVANMVKFEERTHDLIKDRFIPSKTVLPKNVDFIVIGSGMGGLSCAALLSRAGYKVIVLEQHDVIGGCMHQFDKKYEFDTGIHYIGDIDKYIQLLSPITDDKNKIKFVMNGDEENKYIYDQFLFLNKNNDIYLKFNCCAYRYIDDVFNYIKKHQLMMDSGNNAINKLKKTFIEYISLADDFYALLYLGKLFFCNNRIMHKIVFWITKMICYTTIWNYSVNQTLKKLFFNVSGNVSDKTKQKMIENYCKIKMLILGNIGDIGTNLNRVPFVAIGGALNHLKQGGWYPIGGPHNMARSIIPIIEQSGGRCLASAPVTRIIFDNNQAVGCMVNKNGKEYEFRSKFGVISAAGFRHTYKTFMDIDKISNSICNDFYKQQIQRALTLIQPSDQHFFVWVGFNKTSKELDFPNYNQWIFDLENNDTFNAEIYNDNDEEEEDEEFEDPLLKPVECFVSYPSAKDPTYEVSHPGRSCAVLVGDVPYAAFKKYSKLKDKPNARGIEYNEFKKKIADRMIEKCIYNLYPKSRDAVEKIEIGTALSAKYYLGSYTGESYGLESCLARLFDFEIVNLLKPNQPIKGLYIAGQDVSEASWSGAFEGGIITAEHILGYHNLIHLCSNRRLIDDLNIMDGYKHEFKCPAKELLEKEKEQKD